MLAQLAHHGANLYRQRDHISKSKALSQILKGFQKEIKKNTGEGKGSILDVKQLPNQGIQRIANKHGSR